MPDLVKINVFGKEYEVSQQAQVVYYMWLATIALIIISIVLKKRPFAIGEIIYIIGYAALSTYAINCLVVGGCTVYAWIVVAFGILYAIIILGGPNILEMIEKRKMKSKGKSKGKSRGKSKK